MTVDYLKLRHPGSSTWAVLESTCLSKNPWLNTVEMENMTTRLDACRSFQRFQTYWAIRRWNWFDLWCLSHIVGPLGVHRLCGIWVSNNLRHFWKQFRDTEGCKVRKYLNQVEFMLRKEKKQRRSGSLSKPPCHWWQWDIHATSCGSQPRRFFNTCKWDIRQESGNHINLRAGSHLFNLASGILSELVCEIGEIDEILIPHDQGLVRWCKFHEVCYAIPSI